MNAAQNCDKIYNFTLTVSLHDLIKTRHKSEHFEVNFHSIFYSTARKYSLS